MSVFRKSLTLQIALSLIISTVPMTSFAESNDSAGVRKAPAKKTEFGYDADKRKLCDLGGAKDKMAKLDAANKPKMDEIDELKKQIESINSEMQLLNSMGALKDNYLEGLSALAITQTSKEKIKNEKEKFKSLDNMKKVIRNGLMIDAIAFLLRNSNLEKDDAFTVKAICESSKKPADDYKKDSVCNNNNFLSNIFGNSLDKSLSNFKAAYRRVQITDKPALTEDIKKIIDSIPQDISPSAILKILNSTSPGITQLLKSDLSREALQSCLSEKSSDESLAACEKLLPNLKSDSDNNFLVKMNEQTAEAVKGVGKLSGLITDAAKANIENVNQELNHYNTLAQKAKGLASDKMKANISQSTNETQTIADNNSKKISLKAQEVEQRQNPPEKSDIDEANKLKFQADQTNNSITSLFMDPSNIDNFNNPTSSDDALASAKLWQEKCKDPQGQTELKTCLEKMKTVETNLNAKKRNLKSKLLEYQNELTKIITSGDGAFSYIETLKKYTAEKYLRTCKQNSKAESVEETIGVCFKIDGVNFGDNSQKISQIKSLDNDINSIFEHSQFAQNIKVDSDESGATFSADELAEFSLACNHTPEGEFKDICSEINSESVITQHKKRDKEEEKKKYENEDKKYWVTADGRGGFNRVEKKSTMRVIGEGALPVVPQLIPMFFANYAMSSNISMLTDQALFQKQMLFNYNIYNASPWSYNTNYFGSPVYPAYTNTNSTTAINGFGF